MLITTLTGKGKTELAKKVDYLWTAQTENALTIEPLIYVLQTTLICLRQKSIQETV